MSAIEARAMKRTAPRYDMAGQRLRDGVEDTDKTISPGLVDRLNRYALRILSKGGFDVRTWRCEIYTLDADELPSYRSYTAEYTNAQGGMIGVSGIETRSGHPFLHHELCIDVGR